MKTLLAAPLNWLEPLKGLPHEFPLSQSLKMVQPFHSVIKRLSLSLYHCEHGRGGGGVHSLVRELH